MSPRFITILSLISLITRLEFYLSCFCVLVSSAAVLPQFLPRLTNDGNAILREIDVAHPAAKNMIELSRTQDEECGDGTTSVIILGSQISTPASLIP